ncbi:hypothetical protein [Streptomyces sp. NPDC056938]|uniref:hypothetical protein n=1 Tax=unclassified Streptomyces TaxID=2593676 RepID=UPI003644C65A
MPEAFHVLASVMERGALVSSGVRSQLRRTSGVEHLDAVDVPFHDARVPGQREPGDDRGPVAIDAVGEGVETGQVVLADCVEPLGQPLALSLGEDMGEGVDMSGEGFWFGAVGQDGLEPELFDLAEGVGVAQDSVGDGAGCERGAMPGSTERRLVRK